MRTSYQLRRSIRLLVAVSLAAVPFGLTVLPTAAQDTSAAPLSAGQSSAPKPSQSSYKPYFVEFRARAAASYGHMYVLYGQLNGRGEIVKSDIAGFHPAGDANNCENCSLIAWTLGHILFVPSETGASDGDLEEKYVTARYRVMLDAASFNKISAHIRQLKAEKRAWNALINNCVTFGNDIADFIGLKTPSGSNLMEPKDYVERLREMNGGKPQGSEVRGAHDIGAYFIGASACAEQAEKGSRGEIVVANRWCFRHHPLIHDSEFTRLLTSGAERDAIFPSSDSIALLPRYPRRLRPCHRSAACRGPDTKRNPRHLD